MAKKKYALEILLKDDRFLLVAKTDCEKDDWIGQIGKAIVKYSSMYTNEDDDEDFSGNDNTSESNNN